MWQHAGVSPNMCGAGPCLWGSMEPTLHRETAKMQGWSSLWKEKWLTVLIKSGPVNTTFEGADTDPPRSRMPTPSFKPHHWWFVSRHDCGKYAQVQWTKSAVHHNSVAVHIIAKWTATCEQQIWIVNVTIVDHGSLLLCRRLYGLGC